MNPLGRPGALAALGLAAILAAGCGGTDLDPQKAEEEIKANVEHARHEKVDSVACPSGVEIEPKTTFSCTVHLATGGSATAAMEILDKDANIAFLSLHSDK